MADSVGADVLDETLGRLSKKPGVKATLVLDRESGAILKTSGQISSLRVPKPAESSSSPTPAGTASFGNNSNDEANGDEPSSREQGIEEIAAMMWNFVSTADSLTQELDAEDEVKLLRLRTKKQEFVIVPDPKYLLIVVHDTSA